MVAVGYRIGHWVCRNNYKFEANGMGSITALCANKDMYCCCLSSPCRDEVSAGCHDWVRGEGRGWGWVLSGPIHGVSGPVKYTQLYVHRPPGLRKSDQLKKKIFEMDENINMLLIFLLFILTIV
jgi:hypothetical protein